MELPRNTKAMNQRIMDKSSGKPDPNQGDNLSMMFATDKDFLPGSEQKDLQAGGM